MRRAAGQRSCGQGARRVLLALGLVGAAAGMGRSPAEAGPGGEPAGAASALLAEADRLFSRGDDPARDRRALALVMAVVAGAPDDYESLWRAARLCYHVADQAPGADKLRHFAQGADFARRAVARRPDAVEGHFWLAANDGGASRARGVFAALRTIPRIRAGMEAVLRLDDRYEDGSAYRALGELDRQLPRLLGGDLTRAIRRLEQGVRVAPGNAAIGLSLARAYLDAGRRQEARQRLEAILQRDDAPARTREQARRLLGEL